MSVIYYDEQLLERNVSDNLSTAISYSNKVLYIANYLSVPFGFKYREYLKSFDNKMNGSLKLLNNVQKKISTSKTLYSATEGYVENDIIDIANNNISERQNAV